ncbi:response regulator [Altererythrobacter confluentis]|uniref:Sensory/regulatory protein RpfC n=1 Tax=Allopontixanthobacter confluentis TaxID=1849021 RepID=A0A6L7GD91_9SPHN|nr:ATP-binding protein [Allopontixanthobacter confluentis]MXP13164.1 response regulator [Allopontixanthobacter confluentis]
MRGNLTITDATGNRPASALEKMRQGADQFPNAELLRLTGWRLAVLLLSAFAGFTLLAYGGLAMTKGEGSFAAVWMPNAIAISLMVHFRSRSEKFIYPALFAGSFAGNILAGSSLFMSGAVSLANVLEIGVALVLLRKMSRVPPDMERVVDLARFVFLAAIIAPLGSAAMATAALLASGNGSWEAFAGWYVADAMGIMLIAPPLLVIIGTLRGHYPVVRRHRLEWLAIMGGGFFATLAIFWQSEYPILFLTAPVLVLHAFRLGSFGTALALAQVAITASAMTAAGHGPINLVSGPINEQLIILQVFLVSGFVMSLPVAAAVAHQYRTMRQLRMRKQQFRMLAKNVSDAVLQYDMNGVCTYASPSVKSVLNLPQEHFVGNRANAQVHPDAQAEITEIQRRLLSGETTKERFTYRRLLDDEKGEAVYIEADCVRSSIDPEDADDEHAIFVSCRNVTVRVELERNLVRARKHAENAATAKSQFLANMSHEIRTPMNGVLGFTELLLASDLTPRQRHHAQLIDESGKSMMRLLNDILDLSKVEAGQTQVTQEYVPLAHLLQSCAMLHSANAIQKGLQIKLDLDPALPQAIVSDGLRLRQIVLNLIGNAVKFTDAGTITLRAAVSGQNMLIGVEDTGIGIPSNRVDSIFNPFEQADNATSRKYGGTGLGLTISRQMAQLLGGSLSVSSVEGSGSCFMLELPLRLPSKEAAIPTATPARPEDKRLRRSARILLAEDHDINRILVTTMLERCGQQVETAENGEVAFAAIKAARAQGKPFDLVLMDIQMPLCDGYAATRAIRSAGISASELPIVALTANVYDEDKRAVIDAGMQAHLSKPLVLDDLMQTLRRWLPQQEDTAPAPLAPAARSQPAGTMQHSPALLAKWQARRKEALDAVSHALRQNLLEGTDAEELARIVHKLAGTAGMFGEENLGSKALAFERALKAQGASEDRERLAEELLRAA